VTMAISSRAPYKAINFLIISATLILRTLLQDVIYIMQLKFIPLISLINNLSATNEEVKLSQKAFKKLGTRK
jgi:hypothetical protein